MQIDLVPLSLISVSKGCYQHAKMPVVAVCYLDSQSEERYKVVLSGHAGRGGACLNFKQGEKWPPAHKHSRITAEQY